MLWGYAPRCEVLCSLFPVLLGCAMMWEGLEWPWAQEFPSLCSGRWCVPPCFRIALGGCGTSGVAAPSVVLRICVFSCWCCYVAGDLYM